MTDATATGPTTGEKAVLFCPRCSYSAPLNDGWVPTTVPHRLRCPVCGTTVG